MAEVYPQSTDDSHRTLAERMTAPGPIVLMRKEIEHLKNRIESAAELLRSSNLSHSDARAYAHNALFGERVKVEDFHKRYKPGTIE